MVLAFAADLLVVIHLAFILFVVLGGFLASVLPLIDGRLRTEVSRRVVLGESRTVELLPGALGDDAGVIGAAELAFEPLVDDPLLAR